MAASQTKKILYINLTDQTFEIKSHDDYWQYIGGVGLGARVLSALEDKASVVFSVGPLNGFFPFASKTSVLFKLGGELHDTYLGGSLSWRIRFTGLDSIVLIGQAKEPVVIDIVDETVNFKSPDSNMEDLGLPGKKSSIEVGQKVILDGFFEPGITALTSALKNKNVAGISITGTKDFDIEDREKFQVAYDLVISQIDKMTVEKGGNPSCAGCPMGCNKSQVGEVGGDAGVHSLAGCIFAEQIYSNTNTVFACLDALGYGYTHEDIEKSPSLTTSLMEELRSL
jgi:aldehyde:ferredoxin oxidoreductase